MYFDYFYGAQSKQFQFYRIPRQLILGGEFRCLSTDAKLLYSLMLDRMGLSVKSGWYDDLGRVFIYFTLEEIQEYLNCGHDKALKLLRELDTVKGIGLIERVKQGQGKPARIYVKQFTTTAIPSPPPEPAPEDAPVSRSLEFRKSEVWSSDLPKSTVLKTGSQDFEKTESSYTNKNHTDSSIYPAFGLLSREVYGQLMDQIDSVRSCSEHSEYEALPTVGTKSYPSCGPPYLAELDQQVWHFDGKLPLVRENPKTPDEKLRPNLGRKTERRCDRQFIKSSHSA